MADARQSISIDKNYLKGYYRLAISLQQLGDFKASLEAVKEGLERHTGNQDLTRMREKLSLLIKTDNMKNEGDCKFNAEDFAGAILSYTSTINMIEDEVNFCTKKRLT